MKHNFNALPRLVDPLDFLEKSLAAGSLASGMNTAAESASKYGVQIRTKLGAKSSAPENLTSTKSIR